MAAKRPDFVAYAVTEGVRGASRVREIGVAFWNAKGTALMLLVDAVPLSGRIMLSVRDKALPKSTGAGEA